MKQKIKFGVVSIATNQYLDYWMNMVASSISAGMGESTNYHLFTNRISDALDFRKLHPKINFSIVEIPGYGWPDATLLRYQIFSAHKEIINEEFLIYLDADMLIHRDFSQEIGKSISNVNMNLVAHPGYWRPTNKAKFYLAHPLYILRDVLALAKYGALGAWEPRVTSSAFTARKNRKKYVCGGIWMGPKDIFFQIIEELNNRVSSDSAKGIVARWHDESHLNCWASKHTFNLLGPEFCFDPTYSQLKGLTPYIEAVNKNSESIK